ncbi:MULTISPECIES: zinc-dependent alcohol dehydrogenase [Pseudonocardia]|uniref:2-deoxy-scyllo-inosamine dehydrogenase n=2 Tax=Pseudonocardia TaxID=1847 RepID=A0A1Y2MMC5_PSEAH|nr:MULTISPECIES: alcohol dehydrogenase catalytic domain-containing protein [Pseudonocardia]OSY35817.1 2-deoxy-scyllo-inosamine dehydrogenase [Pseudonocardia autotrophica]TDN73111.1 L-iditol 2-dehydrogenase [Pseudonocardia autotrophica]BBG03831.1 alcohol dehydrogenase [Pseudonocardia autotrophica]GEC27370.1 alcohol dehydrogenase [Pseudonocardia saturnea]
MQALIWHGPHRHEHGDVPEPTPGPGEVLVQVHRAGICGSDVTAHKGLMGISRPGAVRGHEFAGVLAGGADGWRAGERVAVNPVLVCGTCDRCRAGRSSCCPDLEIIGVHRAGAFAELVAVPVTALHKLPDGLSYETAAGVEPLAQACHDVELARRHGPLGNTLVIGAGSIGAWIVQALQWAEPSAVTVVDPDPRRRDAALRWGATVVAATDDLPRRSFDTVFDVVGVPATRRAAVDACAGGGTVVAVGLGADESAIGWFDVVRREIVVQGANTFTDDSYRKALDLLATGRVEVPEARVLPLTDGGAVFTAMASGTDPFAGKTFLAPDRAPVVT